MKLLTVINTASQNLAARLFSRGRTQTDKQRGASALEYIVLAAAIIIIVGFALNNDDVKGILQDTFSGLFTDAQTAAGPE